MNSLVNTDATVLILAMSK